MPFECSNFTFVFWARLIQSPFDDFSNWPLFVKIADHPPGSKVEEERGQRPCPAVPWRIRCARKQRGKETITNLALRLFFVVLLQHFWNTSNHCLIFSGNDWKYHRPTNYLEFPAIRQNCLWKYQLNKIICCGNSARLIVVFQIVFAS